MRKIIIISAFAVLGSTAAVADEQKVYSWTDEEGNTYYGDSIPAEYAERPKRVLNDQGVAVEELEGKKTEEQLAEEAREAEVRLAQELQRRADLALLNTYLSVDEIVMHRDRRVELFQAQSRVTELYLRNLERRLEKLKREASKYRPYSEDPDAPLISEDLVEDINETQATIARHQKNLLKFQEDERQMVTNFEGNINRFKALKGMD